MSPHRPALALLATLASGIALLAIPSAAADLVARRDPTGWWEVHGTAAAAMGVLHLVSLAAVLYVAGLLAVVTGAAAGRRPSTARRVSRLAPGGVGRWVAAGLITGSLATPAAGAGQPVRVGPSPSSGAETAITLVDLGPAPGRSTTPPPPEPTPGVADPVPTAVPPDSRDGFRPPAPEATPDAWRVEPGDNLWSIATAVVADAIGRPASTTEVADYWRGLIAANHDHVADPDLIHPGQVLALPPMVRGGS